MSKNSKKNASILVDHPVPKSDNINKLIMNAKAKINKCKLSDILTQNKYEKMVPYNLWFKHKQYKIFDVHENNQHLRLRYFGSVLLTPIVSANGQDLQQIRPLLPNLSLYQPFYPENFYEIWEILQTNYLKPNNTLFLHIGLEDRLGSMEALMFFHEKYQHTYQYNTYHSWLAGKEMYDKIDGSYNILSPEINYLGQAYKIHFIRSTKELVKYDYVSIDCIHLYENIFQWCSATTRTEELDLQATLFYLITSLGHLKSSGSMILRLNMDGCRSWALIFDIAYYFFKEYAFIRPTTVNPFNSEIYLLLNKFEQKSWLASVSNKFLKNLYRQGTYHNFYLNCEPTTTNPIYQKYIVATNKWIDDLNKVLVSIGSSIKPQEDYITKWHCSNDLLQIKDLTDKFDNTPMKILLKTSVENFALKPIAPDVLYSKPFYKTIIGKRAELNYFKRIMDTKPSQIFAERKRYYDNCYLLTWERLSNEIDVYRDLKNILKREYRAEMVTNAWIKMYELLNMYPNIILVAETVKTFHLCEAPGAFIVSLYHLLCNRNQKLDWYAQTLRPTNSGAETDAALDDHFGLIAAYPNRWLFGDKNDASGDITHSAVIKSYAANPVLKDIDFMTADAGLQCRPSDLNEQEAFLGKINMGQIICILACLAVGKSAIFKTFLPMSEPLTISMMYLVTHLFANVSIVKPCTSHSTNSEVYIVLRGYKGVKPTILELLYAMLDDPKITSKTLLFSQIDMTFFESYTGAVSKLIDREIESLNQSYYYYYHFNEIGKMQGIMKKCVDDWLNTNIMFVLQKPLLEKKGRFAVQNDDGF